MNHLDKRQPAMGWVEQFSEPSRFWIRYSPRSWSGPNCLWQNLALGSLGANVGLPAFPDDLIGEGLDDLVYLPPINRESRDQRNDLAGSLLDQGSSVLLQLLPGEPKPALKANFVVDPLEVIVTGEFEALSEIPAESIIAWPLIAGVKDKSKFWEESLEKLSTLGIRCVQATEYKLEPGEKRRLAEHGDGISFDGLFHGETPKEISFARLAADFGLAPFLERPVSLKNGFVERNRSIAAHLSLVAELWSRTGRTESAGQLFFSGARWIDQTRYDISGLCREGNLGVASPLDTRSREIVTQFVFSGHSDLCDDLMNDYTSGTNSKP